MNKKVLMAIFIVSLIAIVSASVAKSQSDANSQYDNSRPMAPIDYVLYPFNAVLAGLLFILVNAMWAIPLLFIFFIMIAAAGTAHD